ncbi:MAG: hypothetical protein H6Q05_476 [Acidobacteria bacterium]|nr:hypothetical protein [Acidobacteriota bacterium]
MPDPDSPDSPLERDNRAVGRPAREHARELPGKPQWYTTRIGS